MNQTQHPKPTTKEFVPLNAPRLPANPNAPKPVVNWFERIAPVLPATKSGPRPSAPEAIGATGSAAVAACFRNVEDLQREERERQRVRIPEPPELTQMREEAEQAAKHLISQAHLKAKAIEEAARQAGYEVGRQAGYDDGYREAERAAIQQASREREAYREDIETFIGHIERERQRAWSDMEPQIISLVFEMARKVIKQEIEVSREVAVSVVRNALRRVAESGSLRIRVAPEDLQTVRERREDLLALIDNMPHVEIIEDRRVGPGGCIVETSAGNIDARIDTQIADVAASLGLKAA